MLWTGWLRADAIASLLVAALMLRAAYGLLRDSGRIFLEAAPSGLDPDEIGRTLVAQSCVAEVHDLHVWEISSGFPALTAHVLVSPDCDCHATRRRLAVVLEERFGIGHTTLQVDHAQPRRRCRSPRAARASCRRARPARSRAARSESVTQSTSAERSPTRAAAARREADATRGADGREQRDHDQRNRAEPVLGRRGGEDPEEEDPDAPRKSASILSLPSSSRRRRTARFAPAAARKSSARVSACSPHS